MSDLIITPRTRVHDLLESYPQLETVLIEFAPAFRKLRNPVLRRTVGKIATLQQAAAVGQVAVEDLINRLRREVGQDIYGEASSTLYRMEQPDWYAAGKVSGGLDARSMLAAGEHPVAQVLADLNDLAPDSLYKLTAPFLPAPLIDKAISLGFEHWVRKIDEDQFEVYFRRSPVAS